MLIYSVLAEPIYYPRYLILTAPWQSCWRCASATLARKPWPIAGVLVLCVVAAFPNYFFTQRGPYAKEGWDYSQVADLIGSHAAPGIACWSTTRWWLEAGPDPPPPGHPAGGLPVGDRCRARLAPGPRSAPCRTVKSGGVVDDGQDQQVPHAVDDHQPRQSRLPDHQAGQSLSPGSAFGHAPAFQFPSFLGFRIVERWQFHYSQVIKSTR